MGLIKTHMEAPSRSANVPYATSPVVYLCLHYTSRRL